MSGALVSDDFVVLRTAAEHGVGLTRLPNAVVHHALRAGRLITVPDAFAPAPTPVHMLHVGLQRMPPRTRAFMDFACPRMVQALDDSSSKLTPRH